MRAIVQRVSEASLLINNSKEEKIKKGLIILLGIEENDSKDDIEWLSGKIARLRIFKDSNGIMNLSVCEIDGEVMVISQFTLFASTKKGNRPSFIRAAKQGIAIPIYKKFIAKISSDLNKPVKTGEFGAYMQIYLVNDGPVTIIIDTKNKE